MIDRTQIGNIDWVLIGLLVFNSALGVVFIFSASQHLPGDYYIRQIIFIIVSLLVLLLLLSVDYNTLVSYSFLFYVFFLIILVGILLFGVLISGAKSWIKFPFFQIQPSEIMKIAVILLLAQIFAGFKSVRLTFGKALLSGAVIAAPLLLVGLQPDLGTALSYIPIYFGRSDRVRTYNLRFHPSSIHQ